MDDGVLEDDGAIYDFWQWLARKRVQRDLTVIENVLELVDQFDSEGP